jgi:ATP-binding cassette, subfamily B, bacterial
VERLAERPHPAHQRAHGLRPPTSGEVLLDGAPLRDYELRSPRARTGPAFQDFARFSLTLRENVAVGAGVSRQADVADAVGAAVERAAAWSGADEVAAALPRGYDTGLTRCLEGGVELSDGQGQKVALARSAARDGALVLLDEPTSALDADAEHHLLERLGDLMEGRTTLLLSHRLSTVRMADHIVVLEHGRVVEEGSHDELAAAGGRYAALFDMQAGRYR